MVTIKDVGKRCGVSAMTVSHVLNNTATISAETRARVMAAVEELNYQPSAFARGLVGKRSKIIGIAYPDIVKGSSGIRNSYESLLLDAVITEAAERDNDVALFTRRELHKEPVRQPRYGGICDGLVLVSPQVGSGIMTPLIRTAYPFVLVSDFTDNPKVSCFDIDNVFAARTATAHLIANGHRRIAVVHLGDEIGCNQARMTGFQEELAARGIPFHPEFAIRGKLPQWPEHADFENEILRMMRLPSGQRPSAIFCFGDLYAVYVIDILRAAGIYVPYDVSVIGINDEIQGQLCSPALTTIRQPTWEIGRRATQTLFEIIDGTLPHPRKERFGCELIERASVARVASG